MAHVAYAAGRITADSGPTGTSPPAATAHLLQQLERRPRPLGRPTPDRPVLTLYIECLL